MTDIEVVHWRNIIFHSDRHRGRSLEKYYSSLYDRHRGRSLEKYYISLYDRHKDRSLDKYYISLYDRHRGRSLEKYYIYCMTDIEVGHWRNIIVDFLTVVEGH